ncbi:MAG: T9SS type A sorting domain-containing protein, partial [Bacteroidota bacterium]|nr:T9SS type A sorting domain-containing protein [Bacteroidota bacterium]
PAYQAIITINFEGLYDILFNVFCHAVSLYGSYMDTTKIGIVGHSFGAGAASAMTIRCQAKGWGYNSRFMLLHAPWYVFGITQDQLRHFPNNCKMLIQVYEEDRTNDHRMAADLFANISIPLSEKDFMLVYSDTSTVFSYKLSAVHTTPVANLYGIGYDYIDGLDYYATWRLFDAMADYSFNNNSTAKEVALGNGSALQNDFGMWPSPELRPVKKPYTGDTPITIQSEDYYTWKWSNSVNPRKGISGVKEDNLITDFSLAQNYPNPFNPSTRITYNIPYSSNVMLSIYNSLGQLVKGISTLRNPGNYEETFNANSLSSGVYFYTLRAVSLDGQHTFNQTRKMILVK